MSDTEVVFTYHVAGVQDALEPGNPLWGTYLTGGAGFRREGSTINSDVLEQDRLSIGDYFDAAKIFLQSDGYLFIRKGLAFYLRYEIIVSDIDAIDIFLEKHGAFYHPSRIVVGLNHSGSFVFVLNAAVSYAGLSLIEHEYRCLERLNRLEGADKCIPRVFGMDILNFKENEIGFFLAHWFQGFQEFHATGTAGTEGVALWTAGGELIPVPYPACFPLFEQASRVLTRLYNVITFEQVFPWHHAAGDFVVMKVKERFEVRLITVRGYAPMLEIDSGCDSPGLGDIHIGLLAFLTNLSIRMRIDRVGGTGEYCLFHPAVISSVLQGFFQELKLKKLDHLPGICLHETFMGFLSELSLQDFRDMFLMLAASGSRNRPETTLIKNHIEEHVIFFWEKFMEIGKKCFFIDNA